MAVAVTTRFPARATKTDNDVLGGGGANDKLWGDAGDDSLFGGSGQDISLRRPCRTSWAPGVLAAEFQRHRGSLRRPSTFLMENASVSQACLYESTL
jgi:hypothetical protein